MPETTISKVDEIKARLRAPKDTGKTVDTITSAVNPSDVDAILNKHQPNERQYAKIGEERAQKTEVERKITKANKTDSKRTSVYMSYDDFTKYSELKTRCSRLRGKLSYEILIKYAMDELRKVDDKLLAEVLTKYK
jgi:hypothetical protein